MAKIHVSISAEPIFNLGNLEITNSMLTGIVVSIFLIVFAIKSSKKIKAHGKPKGIQNIVEMVFESLLNLMIGIAGDQKAKEFFPVVATLFLFILFSNWSGLIPGVGTIGIKENSVDVSVASKKHNNQPVESTLINTDDTLPLEEIHVLKNDEVSKETDLEQKIPIESTEKHEETEETIIPLARAPSADLNTTLALALVSMVGVQIVGVKYLKLGYFKKFFDLSSPMKFVLGILELVSELSRVISFSFRLFGNIFAGEVLLTVMLTLLPFLAPLPFLGLEVFVGLIQALVFAVLTLVFWNMATISHSEEHVE
jgi:F-type H+-transporting ATPase subunit a